jgi:hypothetical protein
MYTHTQTVQLAGYLLAVGQKWMKVKVLTQSWEELTISILELNLMSQFSKKLNEIAILSDKTLHYAESWDSTVFEKKKNKILNATVDVLRCTFIPHYL